MNTSWHDLLRRDIKNWITSEGIKLAHRKLETSSSPTVNKKERTPKEKIHLHIFLKTPIISFPPY